MLRVLEEARGLIEQREDWTQRTLETIRGKRCAVGAIRLAADFLNYPAAGRVAHDLLTDIAIERGFASIEALNDHSRCETVLSVFHTAIAVYSCGEHVSKCQRVPQSAREWQLL